MEKTLTKDELIKIIDDKFREFYRQLRVSNKEDIKLILHHYRTYKAQVEVLKEEIEYLENGYGYGTIKSGVDGEIVDGTKIYHSEFEKVQNMIELKKAKMKEIAYLVFKIEACFEALKNDTFYFILEKKFIEGKNGRTICEESGYVLSTITTQEKRLVDLIASIFYV